MLPKSRSLTYPLSLYPQSCESLAAQCAESTVQSASAIVLAGAADQKQAEAACHHVLMRGIAERHTPGSTNWATSYSWTKAVAPAAVIPAYFIQWSLGYDTNVHTVQDRGSSIVPL